MMDEQKWQKEDQWKWIYKFQNQNTYNPFIWYISSLYTLYSNLTCKLVHTITIRNSALFNRYPKTYSYDNVIGIWCKWEGARPSGLC